MIARNALTVLISAVVGGLVTLFVIQPSSDLVSSKSDRLSGETTETAFLPERFGVPASAR
jgi:hypothetical protein